MLSNCTTWYYSHFSSTLSPDPHIQNPDSLIFKTWVKLHRCVTLVQSRRHCLKSVKSYANMALSQREIPISPQINALTHDKP